VINVDEDVPLPRKRKTAVVPSKERAPEMASTAALEKKKKRASSPIIVDDDDAELPPSIPVAKK
jgi:hypothetical protein